MATGDLTARVSYLGTTRGHVDLDEVLTLLRAIRDRVTETERKVDQLMTEAASTVDQIKAMADQIEGISARQDAAAQILRDFVATHDVPGGQPVDPATLLEPIKTAIGHLEGTTEEIEGVVPPNPDQPPAP